MYYITGEKIQIGDTFCLIQEKIVGIIDDVISTQKKQSFWRLNEFGLMIECDEFGLLFLPYNFIENITFIARKLC